MISPEWGTLGRCTPGPMTDHTLGGVCSPRSRSYRVEGHFTGGKWIIPSHGQWSTETDGHSGDVLLASPSKTYLVAFAAVSHTFRQFGDTSKSPFRPRR